MKKELALIMPVYNEEGAIKNVLEKWNNTLSSLNIDYQIFVYNDGSKDKTPEILNAISSEYKNITTINKENSGHGPTILKGYCDNANDFEWIFQIDSDDEMKEDSFYKLWEKRQNYDFLIGTRDGRKQALSRKIISAVSRMCIKIFYGQGVWDVNSPYRLMRTKKFKDIYFKIPKDTFAPNVIISGYCARKKLRFLEIPVYCGIRETGEISIKHFKLFKAAVKSFWQTVLFSFTKM